MTKVIVPMPLDMRTDLETRGQAALERQQAEERAAQEEDAQRERQRNLSDRFHALADDIRLPIHSNNERTGRIKTQRITIDEAEGTAVKVAFTYRRQKGLSMTAKVLGHGVSPISEIEAEVYLELHGAVTVPRTVSIHQANPGFRESALFSGDSFKTSTRSSTEADDADLRLSLIEGLMDAAIAAGEDDDTPRILGHLGMAYVRESVGSDEFAAALAEMQRVWDVEVERERDAELEDEAMQEHIAAGDFAGIPTFPPSGTGPIAFIDEPPSSPGA